MALRQKATPPTAAIHPHIFLLLHWTDNEERIPKTTLLAVPWIMITTSTPQTPTHFYPQQPTLNTCTQTCVCILRVETQGLPTSCTSTTPCYIRDFLVVFGQLDRVSGNAEILFVLLGFVWLRLNNIQGTATSWPCSVFNQLSNNKFLSADRSVSYQEDSSDWHCGKSTLDGWVSP